MRVLVTGVAGYVGSVCAEVCVSAGHQVVGYDNLEEGHLAAVPNGVSFIRGDLGDVERLDFLFRHFRPDAVMHFANAATVPESMEKPEKFLRVNVAYGGFLVETMLRHKVKKLIYSSSAAVYGEPETVPITEEHSTRPVNLYGQTKLMFEELLRWHSSVHGLSWTGLRYFNAAGASPRLGEAHRRETHIIPLLLEVALGRQPVFEIYGTDYETRDGTCIRDYVHVLDIAQAHLTALSRLDGSSAEVFNVGTGQGNSVAEVIETVREVSGRPIPVREGARRAGDPAVLVASGERIGRMLGWAPRFSLRETVGSAWSWKVNHPDGYGVDEAAEKP